MLPSIVPELISDLGAYHVHPISAGRSGARVYHLTAPGRPALYVKTADALHRAELEDEHARLAWLQGKAPVPEIVAFRGDNQQTILVTRALPGVSAARVPERDRRGVVRALGAALRAWHAIPAAGCPFDRSRSAVIAAARQRVEAGLVDESDFDAERQGLTARELLPLLEQQRPAEERLVVTHGDACLDNVIVEKGRLRGLVDCGRSGLADAYQDLALASRDIEGEYGPEFVDAFFEAYGLREVDERKLEYYRLADEFF